MRRASALALVGSLTLAAVFGAGRAEAQPTRRTRARPTSTPRSSPTQVSPSRQASSTSQESLLSEADRAQARSLFAAGAAAVDAGRWTDAVDSFRRAFTLTGAPSALFNTAFALRALGRLREAMRAFDELLAMADLGEAMRAQASELRDEVRGRLPLLRLEGLDAEARHVVRLDAEGVEDRGARPLVLEVDPGRHTVDVTRAGFDRFEWTGTLADGQRLSLAVELRPEAQPAVEGGGSVLEEPWLWVVLGAVALGGAALAGWYADDQAQLRPLSSMPTYF